ncbi:MAG: beta-propeller fold lactonase family protein [Methylocella sp.]
MRSNNSSRATCARGFVALFAMLAMGLALAAFPAKAAPFAYVVNQSSNNVSVIDTATNPPSVVATIPLGVNSPLGVAVAPDGKRAYVIGGFVSVIDTAANTVVATVPLPVGTEPAGVAVTPDGSHVYVTNEISNTVFVIDTTGNMVVATVPVGNHPIGVAVTPDGKDVYVANGGDNTVSVIDTAPDMVVATVAVGTGPNGVAVTPDGKHAYVANRGSNNVSVIETTGNTVVATVAAGLAPNGVAITPDGKHAYVVNFGAFTVPPVSFPFSTPGFFPGSVSVIDTATNTVVAGIPMRSGADGVAITPDGNHAYVTNGRFNNVLVIDTAPNAVVVTVPVGFCPLGVGIVPPPPGVPFLAFGCQLKIQFGGAPNQDAFNLYSSFTLRSTAPGIDPVTEAVTLQIGTFATTIPPGSFTKQPNGSFTFAGVIGGVNLNALIRPAGTLRYAFQAVATGASLTGTVNPVYVTLIIGGDSGATSVTAAISP